MALLVRPLDECPDYATACQLDLPGNRPLEETPFWNAQSAVQQAICTSVPFIKQRRTSPQHLHHDDSTLSASTNSSLIDPARRLYPELVSEIFAHVHALAPVLRRSDQISHTVACVCSTWRTIALSTPSLWSTIAVGSWTADPDAYLSHRIALSGSAPLDIWIIATDQVLHWCLWRLLRQASRWRRVVLRGHDSVFRMFPVPQLPILEAAFIDIDSSAVQAAEAEAVPTLTFLDNAPNLRTVSFGYSSPYVTYGAPLACQSTLTAATFIVLEKTLEDMMYALDNLRALEQLELRLRARGGAATPAPPIHSLLAPPAPAPPLAPATLPGLVTASSTTETTRQPPSPAAILPALTCIVLSFDDQVFPVLDYIIAPNLRTVIIRDAGQMQ